MTIEITYEQALAALKRAVEERGRDYVYPERDGACVYFGPDGKPSCGVGLALSYHGLTLEKVGPCNESADPGTLREDGVISADDETVTLLTAFQSRQDQGMSWGPCLDETLRLQ